MTPVTALDLRWLDAAARIAMPYRGTTAENPTVGALVVSPDGRLAGRGVTAPGGRPHAETLALDMAGEAAAGSTLFVTLEPCNHWGRTPPCVDAVIAAGIARVICGSTDPDPRTAGQSIAKMRGAGIEVHLLKGHPSVHALHEAFLTRMIRKRPFVTAKLAVSKDGRIGMPDVGNTRITGEVARNWTHMQRAMSDAVMVGARTASLDNPRLTVRLPGLGDRRPLRVIMAGRHALPAHLTLFEQTDGQETVIVTESSAAESMLEGVAVLVVPGREGLPDLEKGLQALARLGVASVLVEGGARLTDALLDANLVDRFHLLVSDIEVGNSGVAASVHSSLPERLVSLGFSEVDRATLGCDRLRSFEIT